LLRPCNRPTGPQRPRSAQAVAATLRRLRIQGCAAHLAGDFGDHPETAAARMRWALDTVRAAYPAHPLYGPRPHRGLRPLPVAG
jgi:hypothetical protein